MKTIKFFLLTAALLVAGLTGCSKDSSEGNDIPKGKETFASVSIYKNVEPDTRALEKYDAEDYESEIYDAVLLMVQNGVVMQIVRLEPNDVTTFKTKTGTYDFVVIANNVKCGAGIDYTAPSNIEKVIADMNTKLAKFTDVANKSFLMTNFDNEGRGVVLNEVLTPSAAEDAPVTVKIGRATAKVKVTNKIEGNESTLAELGTVKLTGYKPINLPKEMFAAQMFSSGNLKTPFFGAAVDATNYFNQAAFKDFSETAYMVENSAKVALVGKASYVQIEAQFKPNVVVDKDGLEPRAYVDGEDVWCVIVGDGIVYDKTFYFEKPSSIIQANLPDNSYLREYKGGKMYYPVAISDNDLTGSPKYDVRRNYYYHIQIGSVSKLGYTDPEKPYEEPIKPTDPIEKEDTYVGVTIKVSEWMYVKNDPIQL